MYRLKRLHVVVAVSISLLAGCGAREAPKLSRPVKYYYYADGKQVGGEIVIDPMSDLFAKLSKFLGEKKTWKKDYNSYAPRQVVESELLRLSLSGRTVVLNERADVDSAWHQYSVSVDDDEGATKLFEAAHNIWLQEYENSN